ncbi:THUMP domain-containing class I SAM-dependent RNA methyltransferase [Maricaulaceae bacterium MS644]
MTLTLFAVCPPGLETLLAAELTERGFAGVTPQAGGAAFSGGWPDVWRACLELRGAVRVLVQLAEFRVVHLSQLDKKSRQVNWAGALKPGTPVRVEASCRRSKIYHDGAAAQRVETALAAAGMVLDREAGLTIRVRIDDNVCTISLDAAGEPLFKRGHKQAVMKAPLRETLAALFLRACAYDGVEPVLDPMCGSGTFIIEAAEIAAGLQAGRARGFAFEALETFDAERFAALKKEGGAAPAWRGFGFDRDTAAIKAAGDNAERAGVSGFMHFEARPVAELERPSGPPGLVIVNPPYGARIGDPAALRSLYSTLGRRLKASFEGWRVGLVTSDATLAKATRLPFEAPGPVVDHGGLKIRLWTTKAL